MSGIFLHCYLPYFFFFETGLLTDPGAHQLSKPAGLYSRDPPVSTPPVLGLQMHVIDVDFYVVIGSDACVTSTSLIESFPQSHSCWFLLKKARTTLELPLLLPMKEDDENHDPRC